MPKLTQDGLRAVTDIAARHGVSLDAALSLLDSLARGNGFQAQFNHPDLGGMGQWSQGGMIMVGDMFNQSLKYRVDGLCNELSGLLRSQPSIQGESATFPAQSQGGGVSLFVEGGRSSGAWWPREFGGPASSGAQNDMRYAFFPDARRLAIQQGGRVRVYDTGDHQLLGFSQQQGGDQSLTFTSQHGLVRVVDLPLVSGAAEAHPAAASSVTEPGPPAVVRSEAPAAPATAAMASAVEDILKIIERLADLRQKNILSEEEFVAKKTELLSRL